MKRSIQVSLIDAANQHLYSEVQVMQSSAGWYLGTVYNAPDGFQEPGSRDTGYIETKEKAVKALELYNALTKDQIEDGTFDYLLAEANISHGVGYRFTP